MSKDTISDGILFQFFGYFIFIVIVLAAILIISNWKIFTRHYKLPGWYSIIPFYGNYKQAQMTLGAKYGYIGIILSFIGGIETQLNLNNSERIIFYIGSLISAIYTYYVADRLTDSLAVKLLAIFIPIIGYPVLAFSSECCYKGPKFSEATKQKSEVKIEEIEPMGQVVEKPYESTESEAVDIESEEETVDVEPEEVTESETETISVESKEVGNTEDTDTKENKEV